MKAAGGRSRDKAACRSWAGTPEPFSCGQKSLDPGCRQGCRAPAVCAWGGGQLPVSRDRMKTVKHKERAS